jgi:hypothetical protein
MFGRKSSFARCSAAVAVAAVTLAAYASAANASSTAGAPTARASVARSRIVVRGMAFFPVMLIDQCSPAELPAERRLGINLVVNENCPQLSSAQQLELIQGDALAVLPIAGARVRGAALAGWAYPDEPEGNGWSPARLASTFDFRRGTSDGLLSFMTTGAGFFSSPYTKQQVPDAEYGQFARLADVAGFDLYPLGHCSGDLSAVYDAQRSFQALAGAMPTFQWIETGPIRPDYCGGFTMTSAELKAEVWLAVAGGARGIGYFTHTWAPEHKAFDVSASLQHEMARIDSLLAAVRPALLGRTLPSGADSSSVKLVARSTASGTTVIAVNAARLPITVKLHVPALVNGPVRVFGEHRQVSASAGRISDYFPPLAVHVYTQSRR